ncbi:tyrosine-type recombinase/integrase [Granulosicoccus antarcticus]|uniref:Tyrosine recombinase XerD n=1 Tax=Granulosicoccus antarcticus IMCC3135 TaxID=1192854 RepID=A0A2Z2NID0_9GAMM|nr:tyrosine-type recombinase/integrase [Granulosicoccus antarcticus]ASJ71086.1 Tyrosine recombinase XerD [Granulosicoccus antarcticus IMCC3135]
MKRTKHRASDTVHIKGISLRPKPPNGIYVGQFTVNGENFTVSCSSSDLHEAFLNADRKREIKRGQLAGVGRKKTITVDSLCDEFIHFRSLGKPDTVKMFRSMCNRIRGYVQDHLTGEKQTVDRNGNAVPELVGGGDYIHLLTQSEFDSFVRKMQTVFAVGTLRTFLTRVNTMYAYAREEGYAVPDVNFKKHNKTLAEPDLKSRPFTDDEADQILDWLKHSKRSKHNYFKLLILLEQGFRIGEACNLKIADCDTSSGYFTVTRLKKKKAVVTKHTMTQRCAMEIQQYVRSLPKDRVYLFQSRTGGPVKPQSDWFRAAAIACDLNPQHLEKLVCHSARSKYVMDQLENNVTLFKIQQSVGHESSRTTDFYNRLVAHDSSREAAVLKDRLYQERLQHKQQIRMDVRRHVEKLSEI